VLLDVIEKVIVEHVPPLRKSPKGWTSGNCPLCIHRGHNADKRGRFGVKREGDRIGINCFNCAFHAQWAQGNLVSVNMAWFLRTIGVPASEVQRIKFQAFREKEAGEIFDTDKTKFDVTQKWAAKQLPEETKSLSDWAKEGCVDKHFIKVAKYALQRCMTDFDNLYWTPTKTKMLSRRLIIPYYHRKILVGYTARYAGTPPDKSVARYVAVTPEDYVYNMDRNRHNYEQPIVLVHEGVIDANLTTGVGVLGAINSVQIDLINELRDNGKRIIVSPDRDEGGEILVKAAIDNKWECSFPLWDKDIKDAGQAAEKYGRVLTVESIIEYAIHGKTAIRLKRKMDHFNGNGRK